MHFLIVILIFCIFNATAARPRRTKLPTLLEEPVEVAVAALLSSELRLPEQLNHVVDPVAVQRLARVRHSAHAPRSAIFIAAGKSACINPQMDARPDPKSLVQQHEAHFLEQARGVKRVPRDVRERGVVHVPVGVLSVGRLRLDVPQPLQHI